MSIYWFDSIGCSDNFKSGKFIVGVLTLFLIMVCKGGRVDVMKCDETNPFCMLSLTCARGEE